MHITDRLRRMVEAMPPNGLVSLPITEIVNWLAADGRVVPDRLKPPEIVQPAFTWREMLWIVPSETRLHVEDVAEAIGRNKAWVYRHTSRKSGLPLRPHRKLDGVLIFHAGELREWVQQHEEVIIHVRS